MFFVMLFSFVILINLIAIFMINHSKNLEKFKLENIEKEINKNK
jgi:hypothetical protein